ncbi:MAG: carboxy terminal-processing peptidase [Deltaproteobacteria bacterium]|nr:carboxy terminal-processing peptidase [Deltaproteobacteria bacterium]
MAMFFRPGGESTQHTGVNSQIPIPSLFNVDDIGEKTHHYSLPPAYIDPFLGDSANAMLASNRWLPVSNATVQDLAKRSEERVKNNEEFTEINEKLVKRDEAGDEVVLADLIEDREEKSSAENEKEIAEKNEKNAKIGKLSGAHEDEEEEKLSLQAEEALNILADLVKSQKKNLQSSR